MLCIPLGAAKFSADWIKAVPSAEDDILNGNETPSDNIKVNAASIIDKHIIQTWFFNNFDRFCSDTFF